MKGPTLIKERNLSVAWGKAFLQVYEAKEVAPLVLVVDSLDGGDPDEDFAIRDALEGELERRGDRSCHTVANTIFPITMWNSNVGREQLFQRYLRVYPRLRRLDRANKYGLYFQRMIAFGCDNEGAGGHNQLDFILNTWQRGNRRRTALQASLLDPRKDHRHQRQRGFPCLQQVSFAPTGTGGLAVTGFYATQYIVERAYGNYLGLWRLGQFMAHEMGLRLEQLTCIATPAKRDGSKSELRPLAQSVMASLERLWTGRSDV